VEEARNVTEEFKDKLSMVKRELERMKRPAPPAPPVQETVPEEKPVEPETKQAPPVYREQKSQQREPGKQPEPIHQWIDEKAPPGFLAVHVPIAGISILPVLLKLPLVLMPVHIAFLHLIIEPACSIVFEAEPAAANTMKMMPRLPSKALFSRDLIFLSLVQGLVVFGIVLGVFLISLYRGQGEREARTLTFTTLIFANIGLILVNRSWSRTIIEGVRAPNKALWWVIAGAMLVLVIVLYVRFVRDLFRFSVLHPLDLAICMGAGMVSIAWFEGWKLWQRRAAR
jgi:Ca2+-transporting ATPase